jgi:hypothetical protein
MGDDTLGNTGVLNDALSIYFEDATLASAFVFRWCVGASRRQAASSKSERMSRSRALGLGCIGRREIREDLSKPVAW